MDPTKRFSDRVEFYIRARPRYPQALLVFLQNELGLRPSDVIADIGSGTGFLSELFLKNGNAVYGVEPNPEMRKAAEQILSSYSDFISINGAAEATTLRDAAVDFAVAGQAFHWFDVEKSRIEILRILKPGGTAALIWNNRRTDTPFGAAYDAVIRRIGIEAGKGQDIDEGRIRKFFRDRFGYADFANKQELDFDALRDRVSSSSYTPLAAIDKVAAELRLLFDEFSVNGAVTFEYKTKVYYGRLH